MWRLSLRSVRHHLPLFLGTFISLALGVALIAVSTAALVATWDVPRPPREGRPSVVLEDATGTGHTVFGGDLDMGGVQTVLVMAGVISAFVTVFVIAGTCAFGVALRRQDMGLLRLVGAGGPQVRRMVIGECLAVAVPAAAVGCLAAAAVTPWAVSGLNGTGLSPAELRAGPLAGPLLFAVGCGLVVAVLGAAAASRRAARVRPAEALREAELDSRVMTVGRGVMSLLLLLTGVVMVCLASGSKEEGAIPLALFGSLALTLAASSLAPLYLPWLVRMLARPLERTRSVPGRLAAEAVITARLRTASLVRPVLAVLAVVGIFSSVLATTGAAAEADGRSRTIGQLVVEPTAGDTLGEDILDGLREDPRVSAVSARASVDLAAARHHEIWQGEGLVADLPTLARTHRVDLIEGDIGELGAGEVAISEEFSEWYGYHPGSRLTYGLYGGEAVGARVVAVLDGGSAVPHLVLPATRAGAPGPGRAVVLLDGAAVGSASEVARELTERFGGDRVRVTRTDQWFDRSAKEQDRLDDMVLLVLAGPASAYALIAVGSTLVMFYSRRRREIATMRLLGVSQEQVRRMVLWETAATTSVAALVAALVVAAGLLSCRSALRATYEVVPLGVPWGALLGLFAACLAVSLTVSLVTVRRLIRRSDIRSDSDIAVTPTAPRSAPRRAESLTDA
ncbi:ABC transporter permease [Streptomyces griseus]|uniref:ABC transporter permease n=1 Tax=Streptomyces stephensoniae TaxID=3375367 RepID=A0ABU2VYM1_9ACTN|nr:ABC transporter permease [Streptomyces griseus]MDT0490685.1 ABC transporter permease [Streptomyces griseus]